MREILFRGKDEGTQEWVYGFYCEKPSPFHIGIEYSIFDNKTISRYTICPETVGQYTGLTDKNGKKIFEGDIVKVDDDIYVCFWNECNYEFGFTNSKRDFGIAYAQEVEVIGNIHDNPELLKGE